MECRRRELCLYLSGERVMTQPVARKERFVSGLRSVVVVREFVRPRGSLRKRFKYICRAIVPASSLICATPSKEAQSQFSLEVRVESQSFPCLALPGSPTMSARVSSFL